MKFNEEELKLLMSRCSTIAKSKRRHGIPDIIDGKCDGYRTGDGSDEPPAVCIDCPLTAWYDE